MIFLPMYIDEPFNLEEEEIWEEINRAKKIPYSYDSDCPEMSPTMLKQLQVAARSRDRFLKTK